MQFLRQNRRLFILVAIAACLAIWSKAFTPEQKPTPPAVSSAPSTPLRPGSLIGQTDTTGTTIIVDIPDRPDCKKDTVQVTKAVFNGCLVEGMTYIQVANTIGYAGELTTQSGAVEVWQWSGREGRRISVGFSGKRLVSKSQLGLVD